MGFVVLKLPQNFLQRARKLAQIIVVLKLPQYFLQRQTQLQLISPDLSTTIMPQVGGLADEFPANCFVFFNSGGKLKIRRAKKIRKNKQTTD